MPRIPTWLCWPTAASLLQRPLRRVPEHRQKVAMWPESLEPLTSTPQRVGQVEPQLRDLIVQNAAQLLIDLGPLRGVHDAAPLEDQLLHAARLVAVKRCPCGKGLVAQHVLPHPIRLEGVVTATVHRVVELTAVQVVDVRSRLKGVQFELEPNRRKLALNDRDCRVTITTAWQPLDLY